MKLLISIFITASFLVIANSSSDKTRDSKVDTSVQSLEYKSSAGKVLGTYQPKGLDHSIKNRADLTNAFLLSLTDTQRKSALYELESEERIKWSNSPARGELGGIALGDLDDNQIRAFSEILSVLLSKEGYNKIVEIMLGDDLRSYVDGERNTGVGIESFRFLIFGTPSENSKWAIQLDGHHIALNITLEGESYSLSPSFIGTFPQTFNVAGVEMRPMAKETDLAFEFVNSLSTEQQTQAIVNKKRSSMKVGARWDGVVPEPVGILGKSLSEDQKKKLLGLAKQWFDLMPPDHAKRKKEQFFNAIDETWFAWNGPTVAGSDISYIIQGPSIIIEYANSERGGSSGSNPADHVHTIYRDLNNEYGSL